jgi:hypothetical protein
MSKPAKKGIPSQHPRLIEGKVGRTARSTRKPAPEQGLRASGKHTTQITMNKEHRTSAYHQDLAKIPIEAVASIAATLAGRDHAPADAVHQAYELLEIAAAGQLSLKASGAWSVGIASVENGKAAFQARIAAQLPDDVSKKDAEGNRLRGDDGKPLSVPFVEAIAALMPRLKSVDRMPRFKTWLKSVEGLSMIEAGERMTQFQRDGIPSQVFQSARVCLAGWWENHKREIRSEAGQKGRHGRVKSKTDKRKSARPQWEKMADILRDA